MDKYPVWDLPTRLFHWSLFISLSGSWITAEAGFDWTDLHFYFGYTTIGLIIFRVVWGFIGSPYARFAQFVRSPITACKSLIQLKQPTPSLTHGHSPSGGWAVLLMLVLISVQAGTGLFVSDDIFYSGPLNPAVSSDLAGRLAYIHHINFNLLQAVVALHLVVIAWYQWRKHENLTAAMITGKKALNTQPHPVTTLWVRLMLTVAFAVAAVLLMLWLAPEEVFYAY